MTAREYFACSGLLAAFALAVVNAGCTRTAIVKDEAAVSAVVANARKAEGKWCDIDARACGVYFDAVKAGLLAEDSKAELACAASAGICSLNASGAAGMGGMGGTPGAAGMSSAAGSK